MDVTIHEILPTQKCHEHNNMFPTCSLQKPTILFFFSSEVVKLFRWLPFFHTATTHFPRFPWLGSPKTKRLSACESLSPPNPSTWFIFPTSRVFFFWSCLLRATRNLLHLFLLAELFRCWWHICKTVTPRQQPSSGCVSIWRAYSPQN